MNPATRVVFGAIPFGDEGRLTYLLEDDASCLCRIRRAFDGAFTWGEFWALLPDEERFELRERIEAQAGLPPDAAPFEPSAIPGHDDGEYPRYAPCASWEWMPDAIQRAFAVVETSFARGSWPVYPAACESEIRRMLEEHGFTVTRDDTLVAYACGVSEADRTSLPS